MPDFTENGHFAIEAGRLYMRRVHAAVVVNHSPDLADVQTFTPPGGSADTYVHLQSNGRYFRDCLVTAEDLINNAYPSLSGTGGIRSHAVATGDNFGEGHDENIALAKKLRNSYSGQVDRDAAPTVGQAYVIVSLYKTSEFPYHAAAVIASDGNSRVTLEVFASGVDSRARNQDGGYEIYSVLSGSGRTFHDRWVGNPVFRSGKGVQEPVTFPIQP